MFLSDDAMRLSRFIIFFDWLPDITSVIAMRALNSTSYGGFCLITLL